MYFSVHFIFSALVLNFVLNHKFFAIIFKDRDIGCPRSTFSISKTISTSSISVRGTKTGITPVPPHRS